MEANEVENRKKKTKPYRRNSRVAFLDGGDAGT
jgi:hypothetical protein